MNVPFGYDLVNGELVINEDEAKIAKYTFAKQKEYTDNPPEELVQAVIERYESRGEEITYEDAKLKVSYSEILSYITNELNNNPEFVETLKKYKPYPLRGKFVETSNITSTPIISKEDWDKALEKSKGERRKM